MIFIRNNIRYVLKFHYADEKFCKLSLKKFDLPLEFLERTKFQIIWSSLGLDWDICLAGWFAENCSHSLVFTNFLSKFEYQSCCKCCFSSPWSISVHYIWHEHTLGIWWPLRPRLLAWIGLIVVYSGSLVGHTVTSSRFLTRAMNDHCP